MGVPELVVVFDQLFAGRRDVYAEGFPRPERPEKYAFAPVRRADADVPLTQALLLQHLKGEVCIGVYPILPDNSVWWFACDYDAPPGAADPYTAAYDGARVQQAKLQAAGLHSYLERSRSGQGVHLWSWFDRPLPAATVRRAILPLLDLTHVSFDRIFPVQDELTGKGYGNLICLPFFGKAVPGGNGMFLDPDGVPIPVRDFLGAHAPRRNASAVIDLLASKAPRPVAKLRELGAPRAPGDFDYGPLVPTGALKVISPYGCSFMRHCATERDTLAEPLWEKAIQVATHFEHGRDFAHVLSKGRRYDADAVDTYFDRKLQSERIGCRYIHEQYPQLACAACPMKAPHFMAKRSILELAGGKRSDMERLTDFTADLTRIRRIEAGLVQPGLKWGLPGLDRYTRLRRGDFIAVGAAPSMGKTWFFVNMLVTLARQGVPVFGFSAETGRESLRTRLLANAAQVDSRKLTGEADDALTKPEWARLEAAAAELSKLPIYLDYTSLTADDVLAQLESVVLRERWPLSTHYVVAFDYLQFGAKLAGEKSEYDRISRLSMEFKFVAKIVEQSVLVFSQLRREAEGSQEPDMTWWKNSGRIESDQDLGIILVGDRVEGAYAPRQAWITKQREGLANVAVPFTLRQDCGLWVSAVPDPQGSAPPLLAGII